MDHVSLSEENIYVTVSSKNSNRVLHTEAHQVKHHHDNKDHLTGCSTSHTVLNALSVLRHFNRTVAHGISTESFILQVRRQAQRHEMTCSGSHTAGKWQSQDGKQFHLFLMLNVLTVRTKTDREKHSSI